jgi:hypothetical protein
MKAPLSALALLVLAPCIAAGETAPVPKTAPEVQKLGYYVGAWVGHGETKAGPLGLAGKLSSEQTCEWFTGGSQVVCRGEEHGPTGTRAFLNILSYDQAARSYAQYSISSRGEAEYDRGGSLVGNKLTWLLEQDAGGKPAKFRYTEIHVSPVLYTYQADVSLNHGPWTTLATGEIKKVK